MKLSEIKEKTAPILKEYGIIRAGVFGSVARGDDRPDSDIDILIKLGTPMGMIAYVGMIQRIEEMLNRKVDLVSEDYINQYLRPHIIADVKTIYER